MRKGNFKVLKNGTATYTAVYGKGDYEAMKAQAHFDEIKTEEGWDEKGSYERVLKSIDGKTFLIAVYDNVTVNNSDSLSLRKDNGEGVPGNSDSTIKCYHGWRGTTNDIAVHAMGLRIVKSATFKKGDEHHTSKIRIVFGKDLAKGKE